MICSPCLVLIGTYSCFLLVRHNPVFNLPPSGARGDGTGVEFGGGCSVLPLYRLLFSVKTVKSGAPVQLELLPSIGGNKGLIMADRRAVGVGLSVRSNGPLF